MSDNFNGMVKVNLTYKLMDIDFFANFKKAKKLNKWYPNFVQSINIIDKFTEFHCGVQAQKQYTITETGGNTRNHQKNSI